MKTSLKKEFEVDQAPVVVWQYLINPEEVVECVPGVSIDEKVGENSYKGKAQQMKDRTNRECYDLYCTNLQVVI